MADYFQTFSSFKTHTHPSIDEKRKKCLFKKAMELSLSCNYQIFLAIIDQSKRLSIFTNEGNPEQFIESHLTNVSYLKDNLSLKDYSNICQEETDLSEEREINSFESFDDRKPITNYFGLKTSTVELSDKVKIFDEHHSSQHSSKKPTKDSINSHLKLAKINNSSKEARWMNTKGRHSNEINVKTIKKEGLNRLKHRIEAEEDNIITTENIFQSTMYVNQLLKPSNSCGRYKHGESKEKVMFESNSQFNNSLKDTSSLKMKRKRSDEHDRDTYGAKESNQFNKNTISPQLSDTKDFFFQNDANQLLRSNNLFSSMNTSLICDEFDELLSPKSNNNDKVKSVNDSTRLAQQEEETRIEYPHMQTSRNRIIIVEEGGKAQVISKKEKALNDYSSYTLKSKRNNNYVFFHSNQDTDDNDRN